MLATLVTPPPSLWGPFVASRLHPGADILSRFLPTAWIWIPADTGSEVLTLTVDVLEVQCPIAVSLGWGSVAALLCHKLTLPTL